MPQLVQTNPQRLDAAHALTGLAISFKSDIGNTNQHYPNRIILDYWYCVKKNE